MGKYLDLFTQGGVMRTGKGFTGHTVRTVQASAAKIARKPPHESRCNPMSSIEHEPATCRPVYMEDTDGRIHGPSTVSHVARYRESQNHEEFWLCIQDGKAWHWINSSRLRNRQAYEPSQHCAACGGTRFWKSAHATICVHCHPPGSPEVVQATIG
jgi:hypothetical protein